jgi:hypothetical protein
VVRLRRQPLQRAPWDAGIGVAERYLTVGTTSGGSEIFSGYQGAALSRTVSGLPTDGSLVHVRLYSWISGNWQIEHYTYVAAGGVMSTVTSPANGSTLGGSTVTFSWTAGSGVVERYLAVGTTPGGSGIFGGYQGAALSRTVSGLPTDGSTVYVRLYSWISGNWRIADYSYTAAGMATRSTMTSPAPGSSLGSSTVTFTWTAGNRVAERYLAIGRIPGSFDLYGAYQGAGLSRTVSGLPTDGSTIYVRLFSWIADMWQFDDYTYIAGP